MPIIQLILTALACVALWRYARRQSPIVVAGFLIRAFAGQVLFWISWLHLPIARSLQLGNGFWFFAIDGPWYLGYANELIPRGPLAILTVSGTYPSYTYVQAFTIFCAAFGVVASTAILFNCAAYLATCALIERIGNGSKTFTLAAIAFGPAMILWSLQPLKDTFFFLLIAALIYAFWRWQEAPRNWLPSAAALLLLVYVIAGTRWYIAGIAWGLSAIFFVMSSIRTRRWWPALLLFLLLGHSEAGPQCARRAHDAGTGGGGGSAGASGGGAGCGSGRDAGGGRGGGGEVLRHRSAQGIREHGRRDRDPRGRGRAGADRHRCRRDVRPTRSGATVEARPHRRRPRLLVFRRLRHRRLFGGDPLRDRPLREGAAQRRAHHAAVRARRAALPRDRRTDVLQRHEFRDALPAAVDVVRAGGARAAHSASYTRTRASRIPMNARTMVKTAIAPRLISSDVRRTRMASAPAAAANA
jgi:hypothetical protein